MRMCVDFDDKLFLHMTACCMTTPFLLDCMLLVYYGTPIYPLISDSLVSADFVSFVVVFDI